VNATTTNARYEVHHQGGTSVAPINQNSLSDAWASLGTFFLQSSTGYVQLYDYTGEAKWSKQIAADAMKFSASIVYLPEVQYSDDRLSSIVIRNTSNISAQVAINYYNSTGGLVSYDSTTIQGNGAVVRLPPYGFSGLAVVIAGSDVVVMVRDEKGDLAEYNGILASGGSLGWEQTGVTLYAPVIKYAYGGRSSRLLIANAGITGTTVSVQFYDGSGYSVGTPVSVNLATNGSDRVYPDNCTVNLCSAKIWSSNGQPLAVVVLERRDNYTDNRTIHNAFSTGATRNLVPVVKNNYGGQTTGISVQNVSAQAANVSLICYDSLSSATYTFTQNGLPSMATVTFYMGTAGLPNGFLGSAVVNANQSIAALIYESGDPYKLCTNADLAGSTTAYAPEIYGNYGGQAWNSGITVQNVGSGNATVTVTSLCYAKRCRFLEYYLESVVE
jgi:hypothetical protein